MSETPGEAEAPQALTAPVPRASQPPASVPQGDAPELTVDVANAVTWLRVHPVLAAGIALIAASVWWKSALLGKSYFRADDFLYLDNAARQGLTWGYLTRVDSGHLDIVGSAIAWLVARAFPLDWTLATASVLILLALTSYAMLAMLRTLFGDRPGVLVLFALYLLSPLALPGLSWWTVALEQLPLQLGLFCAVTAHVRYLRTGRLRDAAGAAAWLAVAMLSSFQGAAGIFLLFALTSAFFTPGPWSRALWPALRAHWRAWSAYGALTAGYVALYLARLATSAVAASRPPDFADAVSYAGTLLREALLPGAFGGPWRWAAAGVQALTTPPQALAVASWVLAIAVIAVSLAYGRRAWRAWAILAGWLVVVDIVPVLAGRSALIAGVVLGDSARYAWDATGILALCAGLAFLPLQGPASAPRRAARRLSRPELAAASTLLTAVVFGCLWSFYAYPADPSAAAARGWVETARIALASAPAGTVVVDAPVPSYVVGGTDFAPPPASTVLAPMAATSKASFTARPDGTIDNLMELDGFGRLARAQVLGAASAPLPAGRSCWPSRGSSVVVPLSNVPASAATLSIGYLAKANATVAVTFGSHAETVPIRSGLHTAWLPITGASAAKVVIQQVSGALPCIGNAQAGVLLPSQSGPTIPALAVSG